MGRKRRYWEPDCYYHVVCRGNRRDALFRKQADFRYFFRLLKEVNDKTPFDLAAYCIMSNHYHLQMRSANQPLSQVMFHLNKRYADYYNNEYELTGHVFEKRFYGEYIDSDLGMLKVSRYIHLNPLEAGIVRDPEKYKWSSYRYYLHTAGHSMLNVNAVLHCLDGNADEKRRKYREFVDEEKEIMEIPVNNDPILFN